MLTSDLTSLVPLQFSHWLKVRKVGTAYFLLRPDRFLYLNVLINGLARVKAPISEIFSKCYRYTCIRRGSCQLLVQETLRSQLLISLPSICARMETSVWVCSLWWKPMIRNSVFVTFRLFVSYKPRVNVGELGVDHYFKIIVCRGCKADTGIIHIHLCSDVVKRVGKSFFYNRKNDEPMREPWGRPQVIWLAVVRWPLTLRCWHLKDRYDVN